MECYFGSDVDDLVVPEDEEQPDRLPSPDSWSQWGITSFGSSEYPKKHFVTGTNSTEEELNFKRKSFCYKVDIDISGHEGEHSSNSRMCHGLQNGLLQWTTLPHEQSDYQLNDLARIDQMDDIFLSSLLEEDLTSMDSVDGSSSFSPKSHYSTMPTDDLFTDMIIESQYHPSHTDGMGSSQYLKTHAFSPPVDWQNGEVATSSPPVEAPVVKISVPSEQDIVSEYEERSLEESVLQELERVTVQLTEKTRICFRDALYRLAENSKQQIVNPSQNGDLILEKYPPVLVYDETLRFGETEATESETNAIDRTIANLMFNKMDFSAPDLPTAVSLNFKQEAIETTKEHCNYSWNQPQFSCGPGFTILAGGSEVPIIGLENPPPTRGLHYNFSGSVVNMLSSH